MQNNPKEIKLLQLILGDIPMPHFGTFHYNKPNHGLEVCKYYMLPIMAEIECLVDEVLYDMVLKKEPLGCLDSRKSRLAAWTILCLQIGMGH